MGIWYLGALRAGEEMARAQCDEVFAAHCRRLFESGRDWIAANLFNGEYYEHQVWPIVDASHIAPGLLVGLGSPDLAEPDLQLGPGCLIDQLIIKSPDFNSQALSLALCCFLVVLFFVFLNFSSHE